MTLPDFSYEGKYRNNGYKLVIGIDEVGRGAFAGPVVAAAAALKINSKIKNQKSQPKADQPQAEKLQFKIQNYQEIFLLGDRGGDGLGNKQIGDSEGDRKGDEKSDNEYQVSSRKQ